MKSKVAKTPPLNAKTKILCFDIETNGLHGAAFAVGAVVIDASGHVFDEFSARSNIDGPLDPWVKDNVLPAIVKMPVSHSNERELREAFWQWYLKAEQKADYVLVSNGYPVEYRFLLKCQEENLEERYWQHPFPILDLSSLLLQVGDQVASKSKLLNQIIRDGRYARHNPVDDAKISALAAFHAFKQSGRIA